MAREDIRINVSFKNNEEEINIYNYIADNCGVAGKSAFIKQVILEHMEREKEKEALK